MRLFDARRGAGGEGRRESGDLSSSTQRYGADVAARQHGRHHALPSQRGHSWVICMRPSVRSPHLSAAPSRRYASDAGAGPGWSLTWRDGYPEPLMSGTWTRWRAPASTAGNPPADCRAPVCAPGVRVGFTVVYREPGGFFTENGGPSKSRSKRFGEPLAPRRFCPPYVRNHCYAAAHSGTSRNTAAQQPGGASGCARHTHFLYAP
jgi:hypothetical protein